MEVEEAAETAVALVVVHPVNDNASQSNSTTLSPRSNKLNHCQMEKIILFPKLKVYCDRVNLQDD